MKSAVRAQQQARSGDKVELELRMCSRWRYPLSTLEPALSCVHAPRDLLQRAPSMSAVRTHDATPVRCVTYNGQPAFWERKELIAVCKIPIAMTHYCRLVASVESPEPRPHTWAQFTQQRLRRRFSAFPDGTHWRLDLTVVDEEYWTVEYEYGLPMSCLVEDDALRDLQWLVSQWLPAHLVASGQSQFGPFLPLPRTPAKARCHSWHGYNADLADALQLAPQPVSLTRERLAAVAADASRWAVSTKLDGVRALLWCANHNGLPRCVLHVARTRCMYVLPAPVGIAVAARDGTLVLDCELLWPERIVAFDVLMRDGEALRDVPYGERFAMAQADARTISMTFPLQLASKRLWPASHVRNAAAVAGDGVVLHRLDHARETFKWKPVHTVDVFCDGKTLALAGGRVVAPAPRGLPSGVWECRFEQDKRFILCPVRPRQDKSRANAETTYAEVRTAHEEAITLDDLERALRSTTRPRGDPPRSNS